MAASTTTTARLLLRPTTKMQLSSGFQASPITSSRRTTGVVSSSSSSSSSRRRTYGTAREKEELVKSQLSTQPPKGPNNTVKFWPFLAIIVLGTGAFAMMASKRAETNRGHAPMARNEIPN